jgi:hypothetical protein
VSQDSTNPTVQIVDANGNPVGAPGGAPSSVAITDATGTTIATVKAAGAAAVAADPSAVVALSPNSPLPAGTSVIGQEAPSDGVKATYSASILGLAAAALATDIFTIIGSATKLVKVVALEVNGVQTTAGAIQAQLIKRSAANTGGTTVAVAGTPHDSNDAAATAVVTAYTANPTTLGAQVGSPIRTRRIFLPLATSVVDAPGARWVFGRRAGEKALALRGVAQTLALNLNGITIAGNNFDITITWTEE